MSPIIPGIIASSDGRQPTAPTIGTATAGVQSASVAFTNPTYLGKPGDNNLYTALSSPGSITGTATSTPITVSGLTAGQAYTFTVTAQTRTAGNVAIATGPASASSNSVTPTAPGPFFPFFPPFFPFFPPFFGPFFPPFFPPKFSQKCIHGDARVLTRIGYVAAKDLKVGDKVLTVSADSITNITPTLHDMSISNNVKFVEVEVTTNNISSKPLIKFNDVEDMFSPNQPIYVKTENGIDWKQTGEVSLGDQLVKINSETGDVTYITVDSIENLNEEDVHEIRTTPLLWFVVGNYLVVS